MLSSVITPQDAWGFLVWAFGPFRAFFFSIEFWATLLGAFLGTFGSVWTTNRLRHLELLETRLALLHGLLAEYRRTEGSVGEWNRSPRLYLPIRLIVPDQLLTTPGLLGPTEHDDLITALVDLQNEVGKFNGAAGLVNRAAATPAVSSGIIAATPTLMNAVSKSMINAWEEAKQLTTREIALTEKALQDSRTRKLTRWM